ncbi:MAG: BatD family protein [Kofleriaceae bacterium]|nr:BatD family protein [Kofleriaceae bacterium]
MTGLIQTWLARLATLALVLCGAAGLAAAAPAAELSVDGRANVGMPFGIRLTVDGFDEAPAPKFPPLSIPGAKVVENGIEPSVSRSIQIFNGQRQISTTVRWVLSWRVVADREGALTIPAITVEQGSKRATAKGGDLRVETVPTTDDMKLEITLPNRAIWVGEAVPVEITWLLRRDVSEQNFVVPLLAMPDDFVVSAPPATDPRKSLPFSTGRSEIRLPFVQDDTEVAGGKYSRLRFTFLMAPRRAGKIAVPASSVMAEMAFGRADIFGNAPTRLFRATDVARMLEVKDLPQANRPRSYAGAVGSAFSIAVTTSRSVVQQGEPLELAVTIKSDQRLDALSLGNLAGAGDGGLPPDIFTVPSEAPPGELSDDGKTKVFRLSVQVLGVTNQLPALAFSYFDPSKAAYQTIHSEPIALSVTGAAVVSASDVVTGKPASTLPGNGVKNPAASGPLSLVGADLALSTGNRTATKLPNTVLWGVMVLLYLLPLTNLLIRRQRRAWAGARQEAGEVRQARTLVATELARANTAPAREVAGGLVTGLRALAKLCDREADARALIEQVENESFSPAAAQSPLSRQVVTQVQTAIAAWRATTKKRSQPNASVVGLLLAFATASMLGTGDVRAQPAPDAGQALASGRMEYQAAMAQGDATFRQQAFARAATQLAIASHGSKSADVLTDWGNAALGAGDIATATLAYRRALAFDGTNSRAKQNLTWLRSQQPAAMRIRVAGATDTLLFFHGWPSMRKLLLGAGAFAIAILLLTPWGHGRRRGLWAAAIIPGLVWAAMLLSVVLARAPTDDAVLLDSVILRAADNPGAPAALVEPLPRGIEVVIDSVRDGWVRIRTASGTQGWVPAGTVERVLSQAKP